MTPEKDNSANCTHYLGVCGPMALNLFPSGRPLRKMMKEERRNEDEAVTRRFGISTMMTFHTIWSSEKVAPTGLPLLGASPDARVNFSVSVVCLLIQEKPQEPVSSEEVLDFIPMALGSLRRVTSLMCCHIRLLRGGRTEDSVS